MTEVECDFVEFTVEKRGINNKKLCAMLQKYIEDVIIGGEFIWSNPTHREAFIELCEEELVYMEDNGVIDRSWVVMFDLRNNKLNTMNEGIYKVEISYRQTNCLNTSILRYTIVDPLLKSLKQMLETDKNSGP